MILRDPVERVHSNWTHLWSAGLEPVGDFVRACAEEDARVAAGWAPFWHYTRLGRYAEQLEHLFLRFPREQVFILRYRALLDTPALALDDVCEFLGVHPGVIEHVPRENVTAHPSGSVTHRALSGWPGGRHGRPPPLPGQAGTSLPRSLERFMQQNAGQRQPLSWGERQAMLPYFEDDIRQLEHLTGAYFGDWLQPRERSGGWSAPGRPGSRRHATASPASDGSPPRVAPGRTAGPRPPRRSQQGRRPPGGSGSLPGQRGAASPG